MQADSVVGTAFRVETVPESCQAHRSASIRCLITSEIRLVQHCFPIVVSSLSIISLDVPATCIYIASIQSSRFSRRSLWTSQQDLY